MTLVLICLGLFDLVIVALLYLVLSRRSSDSAELLSEITEERRLLAEMLAAGREEMGEAREESRRHLHQIRHLAAEVEQDLKNSKATLGAHMDEIIAELSTQVDKPLQELTQKQQALELLLRKLAAEKKRLLQALAKGERISRFFNEEMPYEELLKDIETKKYEDARRLLVRGLSYEEVASELGLGIAEVEMVQGLTSI